MEAYKERMIDEYRFVKKKYDRLHKMIVKAEAGTLEFELTCPLELMVEQARAMGEYLHILEVRSEIENIPLN